MSPRVKPRNGDEALDAAHERIDATRREYARVHRNEPGKLLRYGPDNPNSYYRDRLLIDAQDERIRASREHPVLRGADPGDSSRIPSPVEPLDMNAVRARLELASRQAREQYDLASSGSAGYLIPSAQLPPSLGAEVEAAARARATVLAALGSKPVPDGTGLTVAIPRLVSGGAATGVQAAEGDAVTEADPTLALASSPLAYISGNRDLSRQLLDRASAENAHALDVTLTGDLAADAAAQTDQQILAGTGANGQALGLLETSDITTTTYTDGSPTSGECCKKIAECFSTVAAADGTAPDTLILTPARYAWLLAQSVSGDDSRRILEAFENVVLSASMPTTLGSGTNEDRIIVLRRDAVRVYADSPEVTVHGDPGSGTLEVRARLLVRLAVVCRAPTGVGVVAGTGLASPSFA